VTLRKSRGRLDLFIYGLQKVSGNKTTNSQLLVNNSL
jgi:hypothetical protein